MDQIRTRLLLVENDPAQEQIIRQAVDQHAQAIRLTVVPTISKARANA